MSEDSKPVTGIRTFSGSVGVLLDRSGEADEVLGSVWLIEDDMVATCAHFVAPYGDDCLSGLKVKFPLTGKERGVSRALYHPQFNRKITARLAKHTISDVTPAISVQKHNAVVLRLQDLNDISPDEKTRVNQKLTLAPPTIEQGLGGNLAEIDLALVIQTITNARKEGMLVVSDERNRPTARIFCQSGRVMHAIYKNLHNEMAIYQIVARNITGNFFFQSTQEPDWPVKKPIMRPTDMLLIESHRRLDEIDKLVTNLGGADAHFQKAIPDVNSKILPPEVQDYTKVLWPFIDGATPIGQLWQLADLDDYAIYQTLNELFKTRQIENIREAGAFLTQEMSASAEMLNFGMQPIPVMQQAHLDPWDEIQNLTVDAVTGRPRVRVGSLLGTLRPMDPWHLVHNIKLLPEASGSPLFKQGFVIGMHCGNLPYDPSATQDDTSLQQMLWVESILECLKGGGESEVAQRLSRTGEEMLKRLSIPEAPAVQDPASVRGAPGTDSITTTSSRSQEPGCREVARINCPNCGRTSLDSARFCKLCGQKLLADMELEPRKPVAGVMVTLVGLLIIGVVAANAMWLQMSAKGGSLPAGSGTNRPVTLPEKPWVTLAVYELDQTVQPPAWKPKSTNRQFLKSDILHVKLKVEDPSFVYLLGRGEKGISLKLPEAAVSDVRVDFGKELTYPTTLMKDDKQGHITVNCLKIQGDPGTETWLAIASHNQLRALSDPAKIDGIFQKAVSILKDSGMPGVEVNADVLDGSITDADSVFITDLNLNHN